MIGSIQKDMKKFGKKRSMSINKLYISTNKYDWTNNGSKLLNHKNINDAINSIDAINYHTSIQDIKTENIQKVCQTAKEIYIVDITANDISKLDYTDISLIYSYGRLFNELCKVSDKVVGLETSVGDLTLEKFDYHCAVNTHSDAVLWTAGCSVTHGHGVADSERWGNILSKYLNMPEITLSTNGSSLRWAADQILRSDIKKGDIVVWGLTTFPRLEYVDNWNLMSSTVANIERLAPQVLHLYAKNLDYFNSTTHISLNIRMILQVINFCKKIGAHLYLANLLEITWISTIFKNYEYFIDLTREYEINETFMFMDVGEDGIHPGPKQQQYYADKIFDFIKKC